MHHYHKGRTVQFDANNSFQLRTFAAYCLKRKRVAEERDADSNATSVMSIIWELAILVSIIRIIRPGRLNQHTYSCILIFSLLHYSDQPYFRSSLGLLYFIALHTTSRPHWLSSHHDLVAPMPGNLSFSRHLQVSIIPG